MMYFIIGVVVGGFIAFVAFCALAMNSKMDSMFRDDEETQECPPCNHHCNQGRNCNEGKLN